MVIYRIEENDQNSSNVSFQYETFVDFEEKHFLQSRAWEKFQKDLGKTTIYKEENDYSLLATLEKTPLGHYLSIPYGPYIDQKDAVEKVYEEIKSIAIGSKAIFVRIQPGIPTTPKFLEKINALKVYDTNPSFTWILDLTKEKTAIVSGFAQGTRTRYNTFAKKGLTVTTSKDPDDIKYLVHLQSKLAAEKNFAAYPAEYLKTALAQPFATLYLVHYQGNVISASLMFDDEITRFYMQSATDPDYKSLPASVALLTTAIFDAKDLGLEKFDFWGITPKDSKEDHPWAGFSAFKKSFGGYGIAWIGTYDIPVKKLRYSLYTIFRSFNRAKRNFKKKLAENKARKAQQQQQTSVGTISSSNIQSNDTQDIDTEQANVPTHIPNANTLRETQTFDTSVVKPDYNTATNPTMDQAPPTQAIADAPKVLTQIPTIAEDGVAPPVPTIAPIPTPVVPTATPVTPETTTQPILPTEPTAPTPPVAPTPPKPSGRYLVPPTEPPTT
jgi:lipid II:glycine glycyltransferase (peptidoglycan interpeptide bridge formation enzyme)